MTPCAICLILLEISINPEELKYLLFKVSTHCKFPSLQVINISNVSAKGFMSFPLKLVVTLVLHGLKSLR